MRIAWKRAFLHLLIERYYYFLALTSFPVPFLPIPVNPNILRAESAKLFGPRQYKKLMFQAVCLPTDLCRFYPQNVGIYKLGMDHYELRFWRGWHHHMTPVILAHHFLVRWQQRLNQRGGAPAPHDDTPLAHTG